MVDLKALSDLWETKNVKLWKLINYHGYELDLVQSVGDIVTAPAAGSWLSSITIPAFAKFGIVLAVYVYQSENNKIKMYWEGPGFGVKTLMVANSAGIVHHKFIPMDDYKINPNTTIRVFNDAAGGAGSEYQAALWVGVLY